MAFLDEDNSFFSFSRCINETACISYGLIYEYVNSQFQNCIEPDDSSGKIFYMITLFLVKLISRLLL